MFFNQGATSGIIATGESWAYHMGHFMSDLKYGVQSSCTAEQRGPNGFGITFCPNGTNRPHIEVLEQFDPNLQSDPFNWIPMGLMLDMIDNTNETRPPQFVNDAVSGFTNQQFFNALESDVKSIQQFRNRLLQQTGFNQQVINLFAEYRY